MAKKSARSASKSDSMKKKNNACHGSGSTKKTLSVTKAKHDLLRMSSDIRSRIGDLDLQMWNGAQLAEKATELQSMIPEEGSHIIAMIEEMHGEIDAAYELKDALEADLVKMREKVCEEEAARVEFEGRVHYLEAKVLNENQLQQEISCLEEERDETARRLKLVSSQLDHVTEERDNLAERTVNDEEVIKRLQAEKATLEAKVFELKSAVIERNQFRKDLNETERELSRIAQHGNDLEGKLDASEAAKNAIELDLAKALELNRDQKQRIKELKNSLAVAQADVTDLREKFDQQKADNTDLRDAKKRAESEVKTLKAQVETMQKEFDLSKKTLHQIHHATERTSRRIRTGGTLKKRK